MKWILRKHDKVTKKAVESHTKTTMMRQRMKWLSSLVVVLVVNKPGKKSWPPHEIRVTCILWALKWWKTTWCWVHQLVCIRTSDGDRNQDVLGSDTEKKKEKKKEFAIFVMGQQRQRAPISNTACSGHIGSLFSLLFSRRAWKWSIRRHRLITQSLMIMNRLLLIKVSRQLTTLAGVTLPKVEESC